MIYAALSILVILLLAIYGIFFQKEKYYEYSVLCTKKKYLFSTLFEFIFVVIIYILLTIIRKLSATPDLVISIINVIFFIYISKDVLFQGIGFKLTTDPAI